MDAPPRHRQQIQPLASDLYSHSFATLAPRTARYIRTTPFGRIGNPRRELRGRTPPTALTMECETVKPFLCHRHASHALPTVVGNVRPQHESATPRKNMQIRRKWRCSGLRATAMPCWLAWHLDAATSCVDRHFPIAGTVFTHQPDCCAMPLALPGS